MIRFSKFQIQLKPGETALELFAPSWEVAEQTKSYQRLLAEQQPRSLRVMEHPYWYRASEENRSASPEEIALWTKDNAYLYMPQIESLRPSCFYRYFGNESILAPLREKLAADYAESCARWQANYAQHSDMPMNELGQMCITETVYRNLLECGDCYPQEYMAELAAEEHPLGILSYFYEKSGRFQIESEANDLLGIIVHNRDDLDRYEKLDPKAAELTGHAERMELLDANLDREFAALSKEWDSLDFDAFCGKSIEIYTLRQLYHTLRHEKDFYMAEQLDIMARLKYPMRYDKNRIVGERKLCKLSLDEIRGILPQMYPDVIPEPDIWAGAEKPENGENVLSQAFNLS